MTFWVYMLHCAGGAFYVGQTDNLELRIAQHECGEGSEFTKSRQPVRLVWSESFASRAEALEMERRLKGSSRAKKLALIRGDWNEISRLASSR
jgi:predicted GIY-YIG superfamily endonuclease